MKGLIRVAGEEATLAEMAADFEELADDPEALAAYHAESEEIASGFEALSPEW